MERAIQRVPGKRVQGAHRMRFTVRRMMLMVDCLAIGCYFLRFVSDPEFGYGTIISERYERQS